jgi:hypothetical protein
VDGTPVTSPAGANRGDQFTATADCPAGKVVLGGGAQVTVSVAGESYRGGLVASYPSSATTWTGIGMVLNSDLAGGTTLTVTAYALCSL